MQMTVNILKIFSNNFDDVSVMREQRTEVDLFLAEGITLELLAFMTSFCYKMKNIDL